MTWRPVWRSLWRSSLGLFSPSSTPKEPTESCSCLNIWNMKTWVSCLSSIWSACWEQSPAGLCYSVLSLTVFVSFLQVIGLLDVFTPATSLKDFTDVWVECASLCYLKFKVSGLLHNLTVMWSSAALSFSAAHNPDCSWKTPGGTPGDWKHWQTFFRLSAMLVIHSLAVASLFITSFLPSVSWFLVLWNM